MSIAIAVENLNKAYQLGEFSTGTISQDIHRWWMLKRGKEDPYLKIGEVNDRSSRGGSDIVYSLNDVSFQVEQGHAVGIIGKNGAGKSTLLKVLSQITSPTSGFVKVKGRVASLLEVGTGFHPELTGRENIFLNGAILGMRKSEILSKLDEIIDFSGVERYIDTPVKRYSSGMYVRLAFAVAAHLESEILIVDEVLAVGDAEFQKKCLGKMGDISQGQGRTVLFVSHNMASINQLCNEAIMLEKGGLVLQGAVDEVISQYMVGGSSRNGLVEFGGLQQSNKRVKISKAWITGIGCEVKQTFVIGDEIVFNFELQSNPNFEQFDLQLAVQITGSDGLKVCNIIDRDSGFNTAKFQGKISAHITLPDIRLYPGIYKVSFWVGTVNSTETYDNVDDCLSFEIVEGGNLTTRSLPRSSGLFFFTPEWRVINL
jgi:lipopolysaccharide transport system ATP-binding protein